MMGKKAIVVLWLLLLCISLSGCRVRTSGNTTSGGNADGGQNPVQQQQGSVVQQNSENEVDPMNASDDGDSPENTVDDPLAAKLAYDEQASAEIVPGTERDVHGAGEGSGRSVDDDTSDVVANRLDPQSPDTARQTIPADQAEQMGVSEDAGEADSAVTYYTVLLAERTRSLFECQRLNLYWESIEDHLTVGKQSMEHEMILNAGCYDVSARLLPQNLRVDDGWIARKNPGIIVKIVDSHVLGGGVSSTTMARSVWTELVSRPGWSGIDAVRNHRVLLLSQELLQTSGLQLAAMVIMAKTALPSKFQDVDISVMLEMLMSESAAAPLSGIYFYDGRE